MSFSPTVTTPMVTSLADIPLGGRGTLGNNQVYARCDCGVVMRLGRPWAIGQTLDDVKQYTSCWSCGEKPRLNHSGDK